jgi:flagellar assembly factor FliW
MSEGWQSNESGLEVVLNGMKGIMDLSHDPENTLMVSLTHRELAMITFALFFPWRVFPEIAPEIDELCQKLIELTQAQEFLDE